MRRAVAELQAAVPPDVKLEIVRDSSRGIQNSVRNVQQTMVEGGLLTIAIVFLFLHSWRSTVITGLTLPIALMGTFLFVYAFGFTINNITLMALSLCVGLLIDDAIVVRENIVRHAADLPALAALRGQLRPRLLASPLCDAPRFAAHFEAALRSIIPGRHDLKPR